MSKMSQLHAELEQQAYEKGYESLDEALNYGATIIGETLVTGDDIKYVCAKDAQEQAHEAWLKEKAEVIRELKLTLTEMGLDKHDNTVYYNRIARALKFIEEGEM